jgi:hypothetical protein
MKSVNQNWGEPIRLELTARRIDSETESLSDAGCCQTKLSWHQPEPGFPENLLGTCSQCGSWYVVGRLQGEAQETLLRLPVNDLILSGSFNA